LIIELDGGQHDLPSVKAYDEERTKFLQSQNVKVLRFWNNDVLMNTNAVLEIIQCHLPAHPHLHSSTRQKG
jgi:type I restriction enzyme M protein